MATAASLIKKQDKLLGKYAPFVGTAYKRVTSKSGGDPVTGRGATVTYSDTEFAVTPTIKSLALNNAVLKGSYGDVMKMVGDSVNPVTDLLMNVSSTAISVDDLSNPSLTIVVKSGAQEEEYFIVDYEGTAFQGEYINFNLIIRSKRRVSS